MHHRSLYAVIRRVGCSARLCVSLLRVLLVDLPRVVALVLDTLLRQPCVQLLRAPAIIFGYSSNCDCIRVLQDRLAILRLGLKLPHFAARRVSARGKT